MHNCSDLHGLSDRHLCSSSRLESESLKKMDIRKENIEESLTQIVDHCPSQGCPICTTQHVKKNTKAGERGLTCVG